MQLCEQMASERDQICQQMSSKRACQGASRDHEERCQQARMSFRWRAGGTSIPESTSKLLLGESAAAGCFWDTAGCSLGCQYNQNTYGANSHGSCNKWYEWYPTPDLYSKLGVDQASGKSRCAKVWANTVSPSYGTDSHSSNSARKQFFAGQYKTKSLLKRSEEPITAGGSKYTVQHKYGCSPVELMQADGMHNYITVVVCGCREVWCKLGTDGESQYKTTGTCYTDTQVMGCFSYRDFEKDYPHFWPYSTCTWSWSMLNDVNNMASFPGFNHPLPPQGTEIPFTQQLNF